MIELKQCWSCQFSIRLSRLSGPPSVLAPASVTVVWVPVAMLGLDNGCSVLTGCEAGAARGDLTYIHFSQWMEMKPGASLPTLPSALEPNPNARFLVGLQLLPRGL